VAYEKRLIATATTALGDGTTVTAQWR